MKKVKYNSFVKENQIDSILEQRYHNKECPECHKNGIYAGCIEDQYDDKKGEYVILSFNVFCKECGAVLTKWDNTNRTHFLG